MQETELFSLDGMDSIFLVRMTEGFAENTLRISGQRDLLTVSFYDS